MPGIREQLAQALTGRYAVERELGAGGMATVYLARDLKHDRAVAIKVVRPEIAAAFGAERFLREVAISAHLQHPNILTLIDSGEAAGLLYCVMPYIEGETLRARLAREGPLPATDAARILCDVLDALAYAHRQGIVHRDIKPDNIMLAGRHAFVMDFGIAKAASAAAELSGTPHATLTTLGLAIGTPAYMAPEQAAGERTIDGRADLYAVGVVGYEMLSGKPPFAGASAQAILAAQISRTPDPLGGAVPDLPAGLGEAIMRCLEKDPAARWQSAEELLARIEEYSTPGGGLSAAPRGGSISATTGVGRGRLVLAAVILAVGGGLLWFGPGRHYRQARWARELGIPQLLALSDQGQWDSAYALARRVDSMIPGDSLFKALRPKFARRVNILTDPPGAMVWRKDYAASDSAWVRLGPTPLDSILMALQVSRLRIESPGRRTLELAFGVFGFPQDTIRLPLDSTIPREMIPIPASTVSLLLPGLEHEQSLRLGDYLMDRYEVTNRDYKRFVDSGGYRRQEYWEYPFVKDGQPIPWARAMAAMTDRTGRPGPSTWEAAEYPAGEEEYPVGGVSWYEAAAYAKFAGKALPTVYHWFRAAGIPLGAWLVPLSNFSGQGAGKVGTYRGISTFGNYDMGGNVREWCYNATGTERFILGGGWNDAPYQFTDAYAQLPFDRSPTNGIRLVRYQHTDSSLALAGSPLRRAARDFFAERPASDAVFDAYRRMYQYDHTPLDAKVVETVDEGDWTRELISMVAAYGNDRLLAYLYLPKHGVRPYPAVVYFPGSSAIGDHAPQNLQWRTIDFLIKSGRAVIYPVYKGTYQRSDSLGTDVQDTTSFYRDHVIMWAKDLRRAVDYADTRPEISTATLAYFGYSWGGAMGGLMPAVEPRIKVSVLYVAGLDLERAQPEVDPVNFLPRIRIPTLMLNGRYDFFFPIESSQIPMFKLLGTPADQKRHVIEEGGHFVPRTRLIQESLEWLDRYQPTPQ